MTFKMVQALTWLLLLAAISSCVSESGPTTFAPTATATAVEPMATHPPTATAAPSPTLAPTGDAAYDAFARRLKAAVETDDEAALRELLAPKFTFGLWQAGPGQSKNVDEALTWSRDILKQGKLAIDLARAPFPLPHSQELTERTLVAQWLQANGVEEYAELFLKHIDGQWKWTGILLRVPYYREPTLREYRTQPHLLFNMTMVGVYRGSDRTTTDKTNSPPPVGAERAFVFKTLDGDLFGVLYQPEAWRLPFDPDDRSSVGQLVRMTAQPIIVPGQTLALGAHELTPAVGSGYRVLTGQIENIDHGSYVAATLRMEDGSTRVLWLHEPILYIASGCRATTLPRTLQGLTVMVIGLPPTNDVQQAMGWDLYVSEIHVMPGTDHRWLLANQSVLFDRAGRMYWRDLIQPSEIQAAPDDLSLSSRCDLVPPSMSVR